MTVTCHFYCILQYCKTSVLYIFSSSFFSSQNQGNVELSANALIEIQFVSLRQVYLTAPEQVVSLEARRN